MSQANGRTIKILIVGESGVGKSTLSQRLASNFVPSAVYKPTCGCSVQVLSASNNIAGKYHVEV